MTAAAVIDLNADLGEGAGYDEELLDVVTSANVACGAYAGDAETVRHTCAAAAERGVVIGAHPGYPDRSNFGRLPVELPRTQLLATLQEQLALLAGAAAAVGLKPAYVKAHGALYHRAAEDRMTASLLVTAAAGSPALVDAGTVVVLGPPGAELGLAPALVAVEQVTEGFADRAYAAGPGGIPQLVGRREPGAVLGHDAAVAQAVALATTGMATARDGEPVAVSPRSICVHGDTPGAVALAREIRTELERAGVQLRAFA